MDKNREQNIKYGLLATIITFAYCSYFAFHGWLPYDEGMLGQMAERVMQGQVPHRDFDEVYTGGLNWLNAFAFHLWGAKLSSLRTLFLAFETASVPLLFALFARFTKPPVAFLLCLLCLAWGPPNYFSGMPSWYNGILALAGTWFLLKHFERGESKFAFLAGVAAGLSFLIKIPGIYFFAACALAICFRATTRGPENQRVSRNFLSAIFTLVLSIFIFLLIRPALSLGSLLYFVLPALSLGYVWFRSGSGNRPFRRTAKALVPLVLGFALPVTAFFVYLARNGALMAALHGIFVLPRARFTFSSEPLPPPVTWLAALPLLLLLLFSIARGSPPGRRVKIGFCIFFTAALLAGGFIYVYAGVWYSVRPLVPALVLLGSVCVSWPPLRDRADSARREELFLILSILALVSLIQFPYSTGIYFCYISPFVVLAAVALSSLYSVRAQALLGIVAAFYGLFALAWLNTGDIHYLGNFFIPSVNTQLLMPERADLFVSPPWKEVYETVIAAVEEHSKNNDVIFAGPDCAEIYFLSGKKNPTRLIFDFLNPASNDPA
ncbi:MAG: hypothetical protein ACXVB9_10895, partial [Bdellovibrionota bacterium]